MQQCFLPYRKPIFFLGLLLLALLVSGCEQTPSRTTATTAYIGGQVQNPLSKFSLLLKDNVPVDTIYFDSIDQFGYRIKEVREGSYVFKHNTLQQDIYVTPGDSILISSNTFDFDESLYFSGKGAEKNNFLQDMFLKDEANAQLILNYHEYQPEEFLKITDSIKETRMESLGKLRNKKTYSESFLEFSEKIIAYENFDLRERYTYMATKFYPALLERFPEDFHNYREQADFNERDLQTNIIYIRFIENYLINQTMNRCVEHHTQENIPTTGCYELYDHNNLVARINLIDSLTTLKLVKDHFFTKLGALGMVMAQNRQEMIEILNLLLKKGFEKDQREYLRQLGRIQLAFLPGANVGNISLLTTEGEETKFNKVTTKPTIVFLWSIHSPDHHLTVHDQIKELREKYPELRFIGVNVDLNQTPNWQNAVRKYQYSLEDEFQLVTTAVEKEYLQFYLNKMLFLDTSSRVIIGDAYINSPEFESKVLEFLNR